MKKVVRTVLIVLILVLIFLLFWETEVVEASPLMGDNYIIEEEDNLMRDYYPQDIISTSTESSIHEIYNSYELDDSTNNQFQYELHYVGTVEWEGEEYLFLSLWTDEAVYNLLGKVQNHQSFCNGDIVRVVGKYNKRIYNSYTFDYLIDIDQIELVKK